jgi:hypothetical protein
MNYLLNLELPLWWFFLPLIVALVPSAKWSKWKAKYYKAQYKAETNALQLIRDFERHKAASEAYCLELHKLKQDSAEREALITELNREFSAAQSEIERLLPIASDVNDLKTIHECLVKDYEQLESRLQLSELAHNETKAEIKGLEIQFKDALSVINRTGRAKKQWDKICKEKATKLLNATVGKVKQKAGIVDESVKFVTVYKADQSEDFNARHIKELGSEVVRGIQEQNAAIKKELQQVDMSTLEAGDSVRFRKGAIMEVTEVYKGKELYFVGFPEGDAYYKANGAWGTEGKYRPLDIIQIIKRPQFNPQVGELVKLVDYPNEVFVIENAKNGGFTVQNVTYKWHQWRKVQDMRPIVDHTYQNGYKKESDTCYKEPNKKCIFDCTGLCKDA